jgi:Domain of unknown function (DUF4359)
MKKLKIGAIALISLGGIMLFTNPGKEEYNDYAYTKLNTEIESNFCKKPELPKFLQGVGSAVGDACQAAIKQGILVTKNDIKKVIDDTTTRQNFIVLSIYTTDISGRTFRTAGAFGNFFTFQGR